jgi:hypothetical protein
MLLDYSNAGCEWRLINQKREETRKPRYGLGVEDFPLLAGQILHVSFCGAAAVSDFW